MDLIESTPSPKSNNDGLNPRLSFVQGSNEPKGERFIINNDFINQVAKSTNTNICFDLESFKMLRDLSNELFNAQLFTESLINENDRKK